MKISNKSIVPPENSVPPMAESCIAVDIHGSASIRMPHELLLDCDLGEILW
jgi:hypothetical protein